MEGLVLAVDDDVLNLRLVSATLKDVGYEIVTAANGLEALQVAEAKHPDVILLDVMMPEMDGYEACRRLRRNQATARIPIMMLTALDTVDEKIKGFEAGADDYLPKPFLPDELQVRVKALFRRVIAPQRGDTLNRGKIISVFSLRGGVGVSSIATNLAVGITQLWNEPAVLVDLSMTSGQSALMLNLPFRTTWADLTHIPIDEIDAQMLSSVLLRHQSGTCVLAASPRPEQNEHLDADKVIHVLNLLSRQFDHIVLDLPHDFYANTRAGLDASNEILAVMAPELASVRAMVGTLGVFESLYYSREKVRILLNWTFQHHGLARKEIETTIQRPVDLMIPFFPEQMVSAINTGTPPVLSEATSTIGALFEDVAFMVSDEKVRKKRPTAPTDAWNRVLQRMQQRQSKR